MTTYCEYWSEMHFARSWNSFAVGGRPPVTQIPVRVELPPFIVEAVRQLVPDRPSRVPIIRRHVRRSIKQRRLQNSRREVDVIALRIIFRVHGRRRHAPFQPVHRLADLRQPPVEFKSRARITLPISSPRTISSLL